MKYFIIFSLYIALNFGQTWNTITTDYSDATKRNYWKIHKIGNDLIHFDIGSSCYKFDGSNFDKNSSQNYSMRTNGGRLIQNNNLYELGSVYNTELKNGKVWLWHITYQLVASFYRRSQNIAVFDSNYVMIDEIPDSEIDIYYPFSDSHILSGDSIIVSGIKDPRTSYILSGKLTGATLTKTEYTFKSAYDDGTNYITYPIYQLFENYGNKYCISGKRGKLKASPYTDFITDSLTLWENTGSLSQWQIVKQWDKVQYAQFTTNVNGRVYFYLDSDSAGSANRGLWKFHKGITEKVTLPFSDTLTVTGMYCYNDNLFIATSNGINTNEDYIYRYYKGKWHSKKYKLPYACTQMLYDGSRFWVKYVITRQKTYVNTSGGDYLPRYTTDIPIYTDKPYFIGFK